MRRLLLLALALLGLLAAGATAASAETLPLSPQAAAACPACATPTGGAQVVNLLAAMAPQDIPYDPIDDAPPPPGGYDAAAERMAGDAEALDQSLTGTSDPGAADSIEQGLVQGLTIAGAVPSASTLCLQFWLACGTVAVGAVVYFVFIGPNKNTSTAIDGGDSSNPPVITGMRWTRSDSDHRLFDPTRGPLVHAGEFYLTYDYAGPWSWVHHGAPTECEFGPAQPRLSIVRTGVGDVCRADLPIEAYVRTADLMFTARHPTRRVDLPPPGSQSVPPPPAPSRDALAQAAADAMDHHPDFASWLNYELGVPGAQDPITGKVIVPNCDDLTWPQCRDQMTGFGFATPIRIEIADDATALAPDASAGRVALVEGEKTGRDPDDVLGVAVMPEALMSPRTAPVPDIDVLVETDTDVTTEDSGTCDLSPAQPATAPLADNAFAPHPSLIGQGLTYAVNTDSILDLPGSNALRASQTLLRMGAVATDSSGFGWRHFVARHGWNAKDEELTRLTVATARHAIDRRVTRRRGALDTYYSSPESGAWYFHRTASRLYICARRVIVKPDQLDGWGSASPPSEGPLVDQAGIWTSYGKAVGEGVLP